MAKRKPHAPRVEEFDPNLIADQLRNAGRFAGPTVSLADVALEESEGVVRSDIQLFPNGSRVHPFFGEMKFDATFRSDMSNEFNASGGQRPIDVNHSSMLAFSYDDGKAYGWIEKLDDRGADGLWASVRWTKAGVDAVRSGDYRFISPEFALDAYDKKTGERTGRPKLLAAALTNRPFLEGMAQVAATDDTDSKQDGSGILPGAEPKEAAMSDKNTPAGAETIALAEHNRIVSELRAELSQAKAQISDMEAKRKDEVIAKHQKAGHVVPAMLADVQEFAKHLTAEQLDERLGKWPKLTNPTPSGETVTPPESEPSPLSVLEDAAKAIQKAEPSLTDAQAFVLACEQNRETYHKHREAHRPRRHATN